MKRDKGRETERERLQICWVQTTTDGRKNDEELEEIRSFAAEGDENGGSAATSHNMGNLPVFAVCRKSIPRIGRYSVPTKRMDTEDLSPTLCRIFAQQLPLQQPASL